VLIRASKTDQDARGVVVAIPPGQHADTDPVRLVRAWRALLAEHGHTSGRLLRSVSRHGRIGASLSTNAVADLVRAAAERAGLPHPHTYSAHSLRAGGATAAYRAGAPVSTIAAHGRWAPGSPVVLSYVRAVDRWRDNALIGIGF
jgi:integrase